MSKGNLNTKGDKKNNFPYQQSVLLLLGAIEKLTQSSSTGLAQESTLISVLNAIITSPQDVEILLVRDEGNGDIVVQQITDYSGGGAPVVTYKDVNGAPYVPVGPLVYLDPAGVLNLMLTELQTLNAGGQLATEATLVALSAKLNSLGQKASAASMPVVLSTEQETILTTMDAVLDNILLDTTAIKGLLTGVSRTPSIVTDNGSGNTTAGVKGFSIWFRGGADGTLGGVTVPNGSRFTFRADDNDDTVAAMAYAAPTGGNVFITYLT